LRRQFKGQPKVILDQSLPIIKKLEKGETLPDVPQMLYSLFRPSVQPYMISWFKYDPQVEISKLDIPILIVQGSTDIQTSIRDVDLLQMGNPKSKKRIIEKMNHVLKESELERTQNLQTYSNPTLALKKELISELLAFINE